MKQKIMLLGWVLICMVTAFSQSAAEPVYFEGEGYIEPTPASQIPLLDFHRVQESALRTAGDQLIVNVQAGNFPVINLYVSVSDSSGTSVSGLSIHDFHVTEDDGSGPVAQTITDFDSTQGGARGISVCLVFDVSGSMSGSRLSEAKSAAVDFINNCDPHRDRIGLVSFSSANNVHLIAPVSFIYMDNDGNGTYDIIDAVQGLRATGSTALFNGTAAGIQAVSLEAQPKAVIAFSDGGTNDDSISINDVISSAINESVPVYTCGLHNNSDELIDIANQTGGKFLLDADAQGMLDFYNEIASGLTSSYVITYTTHNANYDGSTRTVTVTHDGGITTGTGVYVVNYRPDILLNTVTLSLSNASQQPNVSLNICGTVQDDDASSQGQNLGATLYYRHINSSAYTSVPVSLTNSGGGSYSFCVQIPGDEVQEPGIQYYLHATDGVQETYFPFNYQVVPLSIPVNPNHAPVVSHTVLTNVSCNQALSVNATVVENDSGDMVNRVALFYRRHDANQITPYHVLDMTHMGGNSYTVKIPADEVDEPGIDYFISAWDSYLIRADHGTASAPHFLQINCGGSGGVCTVNLVSGWNIFGFCGNAPMAVDLALQSINGLYELVWSYENGVWKMYDAQYPAYSDLQTLEPCHGYWIKMITNAALTVGGGN